MPTRRRTFAVLAALLFTVGACDLPLESESLAGTYALVSVSGAPLPAVLFDDEQHGRLELVSQTLRLRGDGTGSMVDVTRHRPAGATATRPAESGETELRYRRNDDRLEISFVCPPNALCAEGPHLTGRATRESLQLSVVTTLPNAGVYLFRRLGL